MAPFAMGGMPSMRKQHLQSEFAGLKQACPEGVFVSLTPGDPTIWSAVLFVRDGPYAQSVLRFHISFPDSYPRLPPLVTFATDMFHPLLTPLTTYTYTTDIQDNGTVSASDEERLPPGGFSLRHGFPEWFGRGKWNDAGSRKSSGSQQTEGAASKKGSPATKQSLSSPGSDGKHNPAKSSHHDASIYGVLKYIRSAFDDEGVIDSIPLEAAGNPGAWHAWRSHQRKHGKLKDDKPAADTELSQQNVLESDAGDDSASKQSQGGTRRPGEWNWEGVWEDRVKKGIAISLSEPILYGGASTAPHDELIRFLPMEESEVDSIKENIRRTLGTSG